MKGSFSAPDDATSSVGAVQGAGWRPIHAQPLASRQSLHEIRNQIFGGGERAASAALSPMRSYYEGATAILDQAGVPENWSNSNLVTSPLTAVMWFASR